MAIHHRYSGDTYVGTLAEFMASDREFKQGDLLMPTDSAQVRIGINGKKFSELTPFASGSSADNVPVFAGVTALPAVDAVFADLAAARTAVEDQRAGAEDRLTDLEDKVNAIINALTDAGLMAQPA